MSFDVSALKTSSKNITQTVPTNSIIDLDFTKAPIELEYPPVPLLSNSYSVTQGSYGLGNYVATASTQSTGANFGFPYLAFESNTITSDVDSYWSSAAVYNATTGSYTGTTGTLASNGTNYSGEWLQLQIPERIRVTSFSILPRQDNSAWLNDSPRDFVVLGSDDGSNWNLVYNTNAINNWTASQKTFNISGNTKYYSNYRLVVSRVGNNNTGSGQDSVQISRLRLYAEPITKPNGIASSTGLSNYIPSGVSRNGLIAYYDPANPQSYPGTGGSLYNLVDGIAATLGGSYNYTAGNIRLNNTSANGSNNTNYLQLPSLNTVTTVSLWYYQHSLPTNGYLLDGRDGGGGGWIWSNSLGTNWTSGTLYKNGGNATSISWSNIQTIGSWQNITVIANASITDDFTIFARNNEGTNSIAPYIDGLNVTFGPILIYNREISREENAFNFNAIRNRYGLDGGYPVYSPIGSGLIAYYDPANPLSYPGTGATIASLSGTVGATLTGSYNYTSGNIRLSNTSADRTLNVSGLQLSTLDTITTVSLWYRQESTSGSTRYLLDMRTGGTGGWIYSGGPNAGTNWTSGTLYKNGGSSQSIAWSNIQTIGSWQNITVIANTSATDDLIIFSKFDGTESLDVTFGPILIYNRAITQAENAFNFNVFRKRFNLGGDIGNVERPILYTTGGPSNSAFLRLDSSKRSYLESNVTTSSLIATNGGFTATANVKLRNTDTSATDGVYPPAAMTATTTNITTGSYGNGTYVSSSSTTSGSTQVSNNAFDKNITTSWGSLGGRYDGSGLYYENNEIFPPDAMTSDSTTFSGLSIANGTYTVSVSSVDTGSSGYLAFDRNTTGTHWMSGTGLYNTDGSYLGSATKYTILGEWIELAYPHSTPKSVTITCLDPSRAPLQFRFYHSTSLTGSYTAEDWATNPTQTFTNSLTAQVGTGRTIWGIIVTNIAGTGGSLRIDDMYFTQMDPRTTTDTTSVQHKGEWVQLQMPNSIYLKSFTLTGGADYNPTKFALLGSNNNSTWDLLYNTPLTVTLSTSGSTFLTNSYNSYNYFRLVVKSVSSNNLSRVYELSLTQSGRPEIPKTILDSSNLTGTERINIGQFTNYIHPLDYIEARGTSPLVITETNNNSYTTVVGSPAFTWDKTQVSQTLAKTIVVLYTATQVFGGNDTMLIYQFVVPVTTTYNIIISHLFPNANNDSIWFSLDGNTPTLGDTVRSLNFTLRNAYSSVTLIAGTHTLVLQARETGAIGGIIVQSTDGKYYGYSVNSKNNLAVSVHNGDSVYPRASTLYLPPKAVPSALVLSADPRTLSGFVTGRSVNALGNFSQNTSGNMPTYTSSGGQNNLPYISFNRTNSQHLQTPGSLTFNIATNGGFTVMISVKFTGTVGSWERIFDFGSGSPNNNIVLARSAATGNLAFSFFNTSTEYRLTTSSSIVQNEWAIFGCRYNASTRLSEVFKNGVLIASTTLAASITDRTLTNNYICRSYSALDTYPNMDFGGFYAYDRYLSDTEMTDLYLNMTAAIQPTLSLNKWNNLGITYNGNSGDISVFNGTQLVKRDTAVAVYPPAALTGYTTTISGQIYGNGTYIASESSNYGTNYVYSGFDKSTSTIHRTQYYYDTEGNYLGGVVLPPQNMTSGTLIVPSGTAGTGTYNISASTENGTDYVYNGFDGNINTVWTSAANYDTSTGSYIGTSGTLGLDSITYMGEWIQLQLPTALTLYNITLTFHQTNFATTSPKTFRVFESNDPNGSWVVGTVRSITSPSTNSVTLWCALGLARTYYRIVFAETQVGNSLGQVQIAEIKFTTENKTTTDSTSVVHSGEYSQLQLPSSIFIKSLNITAPSIVTRAPTLFSLLGSNNGSTWDLIYKTPSQITWTTGLVPRTFLVNSVNMYSYFRVVYLKSGTGNSYVDVTELSFNGIEQITNKTFSSISIGKAVQNSDTQYSDIDIANLRVFDRSLTTRDIQTISSVSSKQSSITAPIGNVASQQRGDDAGLVCLDARSLPLTNGLGVTDWDGFIQGTNAQQPVYNASGGYQNGAYVDFNPAASQFLDSSTRLLNFGTGGGFTAMALVRFIGTPTANEVVFDFGNGQNDSNLTLGRSGTTGTLAFTGYNSTNLAGTTTIGNLVQDEWALWSVRHNASSLLTQVYKNGSIQATSSWTSGMTNRSVTSTLIGKSIAGVYSNIDIAALHVYDRPLTDRQLTDMTNRILAGKQIDFVDVNVKVQTTVDLSSAITSLDASQKLNSLDDSIVSGIQVFPSAALTAAATNITEQPYGNGLYYATASSVYANQFGNIAFDKNNGTGWYSSNTVYNGTTGVYTGAVSTIDIIGTTYNGEWIQIQLPNPIQLYYFQIGPPSVDSGTKRAPRNFVLLGSNDSCSWVNLYTVTNVTNWATSSQSFYLTNTNYQYRYYRLVISRVGNFDSSTGQNVCIITELQFFGIPKQTDKLIYPIREMTANTTAMTTGNYGTGSYVASASSILSSTYSAFRAFDSALLSGYENFWHSNESGNLIYNGTTGLFTNVGGTWMTRTTPDNSWQSVCWSPELGIFVAVANSGTGNRVMTSSDGINWTSRNSPADNSWQSVIWVSELSLFVAVASSGTGNRVMTSSDGINWTTRSSAADNNWSSVIWAPTLSLLVAVATSGTGNRVMTSPDGINWTARTSAADNDWNCVTWASTLSLFVAVASTGTGNRVMTSSNGIDWTTRTSAADNSWTSVAWSSELGIFSAVASSGTGNRVMTSTNGIDWTIRTGIINSNWTSVIWSSQLSLFIAVSTHDVNTVMTSSNGTSWTLRGQYQVFNQWTSVTYSPQLNTLVAVSQTGSNNRVMTSGGSESGEWLQIQLPRTIVLDSFTILPRQDGSFWSKRSPNSFILFGSYNNLTWTKIHTESNLTWRNAAKTFSPSIANNVAYNYFRLVVTRVGNSDEITSRDSLQICRFQLFERNFQEALIPPRPITNISEYTQTSPENAPMLVSGVQEYPSQGLTANSTTITTGLYGNGTYTATSSTSLSSTFDPFLAFQSQNYLDIDNYWYSADTVYNATTGNYTGTTGTLAINGTTYSGEWLQLQLPEAIQLSSFKITPRADNSALRRSPNTFVVLGSNNGTSWDLVYSGLNVDNWTIQTRTFQVVAQKTFSYFRIVVSSVGNSNQTVFRNTVNISRWQLFGTPQQSTYLSFNRGLSHHLDGGSKTLSIADNGGFTASAIVRFTGTPTTNERIFSFGTIGNTTGSLYFGRNDTIGNLEFGMYNKSISTTTTPIVNGDWDLLSVRYKTSSNLMEIFKDNSLIASGTVGSIGNVTAANSLIGRNMANVYSSMDLAKLVVYDRYLTNSQLSILNDQLTSETTNYTVKRIQEYPPRALTGYTTNVTGGSYGNGTYIISTSSEWNTTNRSIVKMFNKLLHEDGNAYTSSTIGDYDSSGFYKYNTTTTDINNVSYLGIWMQLQLPKSIVLTSFSLYPRLNGARNPREFVLLGSNNGTTWTKLLSKTGQTVWNNPRIPNNYSIPNNNQSFSIYRVVIQRLTGDIILNMEELVLYGYEDSQAPTSTISGRYVKLSKLGTSQSLKVPEISVYNTRGDLISLNKTATSSSIFNTDSAYNAPAFAFDGNYLLNAAKRSLLYPQTAMIADTTNITTGDYGRGIYTAFASSTSLGSAWNVFDESPSVLTTNTTSSYIYNTSTGAYSGSTTTSDKFGVSYTGEWVQVTLPETIYPTGIQITPNSTTFATSAPTNFSLLASQNEIDWTPIAIGTTTTWTSSAAQTFLIGGTTGSSQAYDSYRLIANNINGTALEYPPSAMSGGSALTCTTTITNKGYGDGVYVATASSRLSGNVVSMFDKTTNSFIFNDISDMYYTTSGSYGGTNITTDISNNNYGGAWVQIQLQESISINSFAILPRAHSSWASSVPRDFVILGGNNGTTWNLVYTGTNVIDWTDAEKTFTLSSTSRYSYWRLVILSIGLDSGNTLAYASIGEMKLFRTDKASTDVVLEYPPVAMTADITNITSGSYGNGTYIASRSDGALSAFGSFNKSTGENVFLYDYDSTTGNYIGSVSTVDIATSTTTYGGYIQLQLPLSIKLDSFNIQRRYDSDRPTQWTVFGSTDGSLWTSIYTRTSDASTNQTDTVISNISYNYYRFVFTKKGVVIGNQTSNLNPTEIRLYTRDLYGLMSLQDLKILGGTSYGQEKQLEFPPSALTGATTGLSALTYGNGTYTANASSEYLTNASFLSFDNSNSTVWQSTTIAMSAKVLGNNGGFSTTAGSLTPGAAGGGGAIQIGSNNNGQNGGNGGQGYSSDITGTTVVYGSGGGGGRRGGTNGNGGTNAGSGGAPGTNAVDNTGSGGGGGEGILVQSNSGGNGGSGIVVIRYDTTDSNCIIGTGGDTTVTSGNYRAHIFNVTGGNTFTVTRTGKCDILIVGGGGAGGKSIDIATPGGGGGGGKVIHLTDYLVSSGTYSTVVGGGGNGVSSTNGESSSFDTIIALGGGRGGNASNGGSEVGQSGGSGGGAGRQAATTGSLAIAPSPNLVPRLTLTNTGNTSGWISLTGPYSTAGSYLGSTNTTVGSSGVLGEWLQIQLPTAVVLDNIELTPPSRLNYLMPKNFTVAGSSDGSTWTSVYSASNVTSWSNIGFAKNFVIGNKQSYNYYRFIVQNIVGDNVNANSVQITRLRLYGREIKTGRTNSETNPFVQVDLGGEYPISKVIVHNDLEAPTAIQGTQLSILDNNSNEKFLRTISSSSSTIEVFDANTQDILDTTTTVYQDLFRSHNEMFMTFGGYYDGSWKSDLSSVVPYRLAKSNNLFRFSTAQPIGATKVQAWTDRITISSTGEIKLGNNGTGFNNLWEGIYTVGGSTTGPIALTTPTLSGNLASPVAFVDARSLTGFTTGTKVSSINSFTQGSSAAQPSFGLVTPYRNIPYLSFDRANSQHLDGGSRTFNIQTNGGFTALALVRFTGTSSQLERIFDFGAGQSNNLILCRYFTGNNIFFSLRNGSNEYTLITSTNPIVQNSWQVFACRYNVSTNLAEIFVNGTLVASGTSTQTLTDRTLTSNFIGRSNFTEPTSNMDLSTLYAYDRYLSDAEMTTLYNSIVIPSIKVSLPRTLTNTNYKVIASTEKDIGTEIIHSTVTNKTTSTFDVKLLRGDQDASWGGNLNVNWKVTF